MTQERYDSADVTLFTGSEAGSGHRHHLDVGVQRVLFPTRIEPVSISVRNHAYRGVKDAHRLPIIVHDGSVTCQLVTTRLHLDKHCLALYFRRVSHE